MLERYRVTHWGLIADPDGELVKYAEAQATIADLQGQLNSEDEGECRRPCSPEVACEECSNYWDRMRAEGYWKDGSGWTDKGMQEMLK